MDKMAAVKDIASNFVTDLRNGVLREMPPDRQVYRECLGEYGYGKFVDDDEIEKMVTAEIESIMEQKISLQRPAFVKLTVEQSTIHGIRKIMAMLEKHADLSAFQLDIIISILKDKIAPLVVGSGNIPVLFAYQAIKKLLENIKEQKLRAMEAPNPMQDDSLYDFPIFDQPAYGTKTLGDLTNDQLEQVGEEMAERAHERWMEREKAKGTGENKNMVPYAELSEEDKESDRDYGYEFMDLLDEEGFDVVPKEVGG